MKQPTATQPDSVPQESDPIDRWHAWRRRSGAIYELCRALVEGVPLHRWVEDRGFDFYLVNNWLRVDPARADIYAQALEIMAGDLLDEVLVLKANDDVLAAEEIPLEDAEELEALCVRDRQIRQEIQLRKWCVAQFHRVAQSVRAPFKGRHPQNRERDRIRQEPAGPPGASPSAVAQESCLTFPTRPDAAATPPPAPDFSPQGGGPESGQPGSPAPANVSQAGDAPPATGQLQCVPPVRSAKIPGRNEPCPCGSGKKFKKCCG